MKKIIKKYLPQKFSFAARGFLDRFRALNAYRYDRIRFMKHYTYGGPSDNQVNIEAHVVFHTHQIEKGLSHAEFRAGFGKDVLRKLKSGLDRLVDHDSTVYIAALSAINAYISVHDEYGYDITENMKILGDNLVSEALASESNISGYSIITRKSKLDNRSKNFKELFNNRYTVREFSSKSLDIKKIYEAIDIATKTPTVCNRQSFRILLITDPDTIKKALGVQNGFRGYDYPPALAIIVTDSRAFRGVAERNNQYIDGGSFMMSFLLGLEYVGLAACPLNTMFSVKEEKKVRGIVDIDDNYNFISYVAIGNFRENNKVAKSFRFPVEEIIVEV